MTVGAGNFGPLFKRLYPNGLKEALYEDSPSVGIIPKDTSFEGEAKAVVIHLSGVMGSHTFEEAQRHASDAESRRFLVTRVKDYAVATMDAETMLASKSNKGAVARTIDMQTRSALYTIGRSVGAQLFGDGDGYLGAVGSLDSTDGIVLADPRDVVNFEVGYRIGFYDSSASADLTATANNWPIITSINRETGLIRFDEDVSGGSAILSAAVAAGDSLYRVGDRSGGAGLGASGFGKWLPLAAPTSGDSFFGVDRSVDPVRLAGNRIVGSGARLEDTVMTASAKVMINGGRPDTLIVNPLRFAELNKSSYSKTEFCDISTDIARVGYKGIRFPTPSGVVEVLPDPQCPYATGWLLQKNTWEICSLGPLPHFAKDDGSKYDRQATADGIEFRIRAFWNLICHKPHCNARITW